MSYIELQSDFTGVPLATKKAALSVVGLTFVDVHSDGEKQPHVNDYAFKYCGIYILRGPLLFIVCTERSNIW